MKNIDIRKYWQQFCHWKGWHAFASACKQAWFATLRWQGWKKLFFLSSTLSLLLFILCCAALVWVFLNGMEFQFWAYGLYALSAYTLAALCVRLPAAIREEGSWRKRHPKVDAFLKNEELMFRLDLYREQIINFGYGIYKIASGVLFGSAWIGCDGIYNLAQALIQLF